MSNVPCSGGEVSGELPAAMWLSSNPGDEASGFVARKFAWSGCLDAPCLMPAGSVIPVNIPPALGGAGYEGNVSSIVERP